MAAPTFLGVVSTPADAGANANRIATINPSPLSMQTGDLCYIAAGYRHDGAALSIGVTGGQTWNPGSSLLAGSMSSMAWWCVFDGTWDANPTVTSTAGNTGIAMTAVMLVFRPDAGTSGNWAIDVADNTTVLTAPASPYDAVRTGVATIHANAVVIASWQSSDDITWALQTAGWSNPSGITQVRNTSGNDLSLSLAYKIQAATGDTGSVTNRQSAPLGTLTRIIALYEVGSGSPPPDPPPSGFADGEIGRFAIGETVEVGGPGQGTTPILDYIISTSPKFRLGTIATPNARTNHRLVYSYGKDLSGGEQVDFEIRVYEGSTLRLTRMHSGVGSTVQSVDALLTAAEAESFTAYSDLYLEFEFARHKDGSARIGRVYWARLEVPDAGVGGPYTFAPAGVLNPHRLAAPGLIPGPPIVPDQVLIAGVEVSVLENPPLEIVDVIEARSIATFSVLDPDGSLVFQRGMRVIIRDETGARAFAGYIEQVSETRINQFGAKKHVLRCIDNHYKADKRRVVRSYTNETPAEIVADLVTRYLEAEDVHLSDAQIDP